MSSFEGVAVTPSDHGLITTAHNVQTVVDFGLDLGTAASSRSRACLERSVTFSLALFSSVLLLFQKLPSKLLRFEAACEDGDTAGSFCCTDARRGGTAGDVSDFVCVGPGCTAGVAFGLDA